MTARIFFPLFLALSLSSCFRSARDTGNITGRWPGKPFDRFVSEYGPADGGYPLSGGDTAYLWNSGGLPAGVPDYAVARMYGDYSYKQFPGAGNINLWCEVRIVVGKNGAIKHFDIMRDTQGARTGSRCREVLGKPK